MGIKKYVAPCIVIAFLVVIACFSMTTNACSLIVTQDQNCVVDKTQGAAFTVQVSFTNSGGAAGNWSVNAAFEGNSWSWAGIAQNLTLNPGETETLVWNGNVPCCASIDSVSRLIIYYNDSFTALNWWIQVVPDATLNITSSSVC